MLTDPGSGAPQDISRRRRPTQAMRELVAARDRECPYCHRPAQRCDFDHLTEWSTCRETSARNGGAKCDYHHYLKEEPGWRLYYDPETQTATNTSPTGRTYTEKNQPIKGIPKPREAPEPVSNLEPDIEMPAQRGPTTSESPPGDDPPF